MVDGLVTVESKRAFGQTLTAYEAALAERGITVFARMLLDGGQANGTRFLSRKTIDLMISDFLTPEQRRMPFFGFDMWSGSGFGLGVSIVDNLAGMKTLSSIGQYGWGGAFGTWWFNDPREDMAAVMMIQMLFGAATSPIQRDFTTLVYQAIDD